MSEFKATHQIVKMDGDGQKRVIPVMAAAGGRCKVLYTAVEWDGGMTADYELSPAGEVLFQGAPAVGCHLYSIDVAVRPMTRADRIRKICDVARVSRYTLDLEHPDSVWVQKQFFADEGMAESKALADRWCEHVSKAVYPAVGVAMGCRTSVALGAGSWWVATAEFLFPSGE